MKLLVLGGTRFLGRHLVDAALARGDDVTIFTRGRLPVPWKEGVTALAGERDPRMSPGLSALEGGKWDAVVDCSGYVPRIVEASARMLASRAQRYLFVSSMSVYAAVTRPGQDERTPVATLDDPSTEDVLPHYGALKAACEGAVARIFGDRATLLRPGLIVGPHDATDRFGYWVARFVHPALLGERPSRALVPAPRERPVQFIDARDLASWMLDIASRDAAGAFNACSAQGEWTMGDLVEALCAVARGIRVARADTGSANPQVPVPAWIDEARLVEAGVEPWAGLPLWLPPSEPDSAGFMTMDCSRAHAAGLSIRPLEQTIADTAAWLAARDNAGAWKQVLTAAIEHRLVEPRAA